jgi:serine/threonine protein kinase/Tfp pilus assembly protein PilF
LTAQASSAEEQLFAGRYRIISTLGQGGMGEVYRVFDTRLQEEMALKLLRPEIADNPVFIQRFRNELKLARKITHRNICRVFDFHEEEGTPFFTMEYVKGETLHSLIKSKGKLDEAEAIGIAAQVAEGLAEAHELGVVHRDLKSQNIMIEPDGRAKIMDFGIARSSQETGITQAGHIVGTPDYISSEQASGQPADHRADIYALGVLLYVMTTGQLPFKGQSVNSVIIQHRDKTPVDPREINPEISAGLTRLILCCMAKDRECRYQNARKLLEDLHAISAGTEPMIVSQKARSGLFGSWKRIALVSAAAIVLIAALFIVLQTPGGGPSPDVEIERPSLAVVYFENNTGDENLAHWRKGFAELLTTDLSQSKYLSVLSGDRVYNILDSLGQLDATGYSSDVLKQVARKGKVRHILRGSYIKAGPRFRVSISLHNMATGESVSSQTVEAEGEENLFALVDDLTRRIKSDMRLTSEQIADDIDKEAAEVTTSSPEAYKLFIEGLRHYYRGEFKRSIEFMDKAIAIDPEFVGAYLIKAWVYENAGEYAKYVPLFKKAFELRHKVSERERIRFFPFYYIAIEKDIPRAMKELQRFVSLYPNDLFANHQLGYLYFHEFEEYEKSVKYFQRNIENRVEMFHSYYVGAWALMCLGKYEIARDVCEIYISEIRDHPEIRFNLSINYLCQGDYDRAQAEAEKGAKLGYTSSYRSDLIKGGILQAKGDIKGAEGYYRKLADSGKVLDAVYGRELLGMLALRQGRFKDAGSHIEQALKLTEAAGNKANMSRLYSHLAYIGLQTEDCEAALEACGSALEFGKKSRNPFHEIKLALHLKGLCQLALHNSGAALETAEELKTLAGKSPNRKGLKEYLHLSASIEMEKGNTVEAISYFKQAIDLLPAQHQDDLIGFSKPFRRTIFLDSLAKAFFLAGQMDKAQQTFKDLTALTIGRHYWGDLYVKAYYWLGKISEKLGKPEEAANHYRTFLELWEKADPEITELSDAGVRLKSISKKNNL